MRPDELAELALDIKEHGLREPILTRAGKIIDERNRFLACQQVGVEPRYVQWDGKGSLVAFVISKNIKRRQLTAGQRAAVAAEMLPLLEKEAAERQKATLAVKGEKVGYKVSQKIDSPRDWNEARVLAEAVKLRKDRNETKAAAEAAKLSDTNRQYVSDAKKLKEHDPKQFERLKSGEATLPEINRQKKEDLREKRRKENREKVAKVPAIVDLVAAGARYATVVIDPPWHWGDEGDINQMGRAKPDYATITFEELLKLPVPALSDVDCHLYLWVTNRSLP
jgi:ParB-like chromosome segregation protein Spo0J